MEEKVLGYSPTLNIPIIKNHELISKTNNGIFADLLPEKMKIKGYAGTDGKNIYVDNYFEDLTKDQKMFAMLHEEGHIFNNNIDKPTIFSEIDADKYAMKHLGKKRTYEAMNFFMEDVMGKNINYGGMYASRMSELGFKQVNKIKVTPFGSSETFDINDLRKANGLGPIKKTNISDISEGIANISKKVAKQIAKFKV